MIVVQIEISAAAPFAGVADDRLANAELRVAVKAEFPARISSSIAYYSYRAIFSFFFLLFPDSALSASSLHCENLHEILV